MLNPSPRPLFSAHVNTNMSTLDSCILKIRSNPQFLATQKELVNILQDSPPRTRLHVFQDLLNLHPDNEWLICQRAFACTDSGLHDDACTTWLRQLDQFPERIQYRDGFVYAVGQLCPAQRLELLFRVQKQSPSFWIDREIALEFLSQRKFDDSYQAFNNLQSKYQLVPGQKAEVEKFLLHCAIGSGDKAAVYALLQISRDTQSNLEICELLLDFEHVEEAAKLWIKIPQSERGDALLAKICEALHTQCGHLQATKTLPIWETLLRSRPENPSLFAGFKGALETCPNKSILVDKLELLLHENPENFSFFDTISQELLKLGEPAQSLNVWRRLTARFPHIERFRNELYIARSAHFHIHGTSEDPDSLCMICMDRKLDTCFSSCGHVCCAECGKNLVTCHMCRTNIKGKIKVHAILSLRNGG